MENVSSGATRFDTPALPVVTFVADEFMVVALYNQNELHQVAPGDPAEIALKTYPGRIIKAKVDSVIWAQGQGQSAGSTNLPMTGAVPQHPNRFPVKLQVEPRDKDLFLAAGAMGHAAIYTDNAHAIHILRMVILRIGAITNPLMPIFRHRELSFMVAHAESKVLIAPARFRGFDHGTLSVVGDERRAAEVVLVEVVRAGGPDCGDAQRPGEDVLGRGAVLHLEMGADVVGGGG